MQNREMSLFWHVRVWDQDLHAPNAMHFSMTESASVSPKVANFESQDPRVWEPDLLDANK